MPPKTGKVEYKLQVKLEDIWMDLPCETLYNFVVEDTICINDVLIDKDGYIWDINDIWFDSDVVFLTKRFDGSIWVCPNNIVFNEFKKYEE